MGRRNESREYKIAAEQGLIIGIVRTTTKKFPLQTEQGLWGEVWEAEF